MLLWGTNQSLYCLQPFATTPNHVTAWSVVLVKSEVENVSIRINRHHRVKGYSLVSSSVALLFHQQAPNRNSIRTGWYEMMWLLLLQGNRNSNWTKLNNTLNYKVKNIGNNIKMAQSSQQLHVSDLLLSVPVCVSTGFRHHGKPAASIQHGPADEPQRICGPWCWETPYSYPASSYSYACCNWGKPSAAWIRCSFEILSLSVLCSVWK